MAEQKKNILIVDDEEEMTEFAKRKLERDEFTVMTAKNGKEALELMVDNSFDLIISDIIMPEMDGFSLFKEVRKQGKSATIPFIVITARASMEESFRVLGANDFIVKPFGGDDLLSRIKGLFNDSGKKYQNSNVILVNSNGDAMREMQEVLNDYGCRPQIAEDGIDAIRRALTNPPHMILIDVLLKTTKAKELIKAIRCFNLLKDTNIITYTHFEPEKLGDVDAVEQLKVSKDACNDAGATKYIGRFSRVSFIENLRDYWAKD